ncbi:hypothetical protein BX666DRAFT_1896203 [Dichotomocladium elegans]|nr:hypothetical protein BX666DRAFT_1896203 [Dichotomocladium elegans]
MLILFISIAMYLEVTHTWAWSEMAFAVQYLHSEYLYYSRHFEPTWTNLSNNDKRPVRPFSLIERDSARTAIHLVYVICHGISQTFGAFFLPLVKR